MGEIKPRISRISRAEVQTVEDRQQIQVTQEVLSNGSANNGSTKV